VSQPLAHLYDLALRTLDDQERRADAVRGRLGPVIAAAALGVTLLSGPLVGGVRPTGTAGKLALLLAVGGLFATIVSVAAILRSRGLVAADDDVRRLAAALDREGALVSSEAFYSTMISRLGRISADNAAMLDRLSERFTAMLCGMLTMLCGLALAAIVG
jgi:hypothetical protein